MKVTAAIIEGHSLPEVYPSFFYKCELHKQMNVWIPA
jgi:hypothetical protein